MLDGLAWSSQGNGGSVEPRWAFRLDKMFHKGNPRHQNQTRSSAPRGLGCTYVTPGTKYGQTPPLALYGAIV